MAGGRGTVRLVAHTRVPWLAGLSAITAAFDACGVILGHVQEYSNRMATYAFEIEEGEVEALRGRLRAAGFVLDPPDAGEVEVRPNDDGFVRATLQVTFPGEDGNRRVPNPDRG
jgi:hypothetical protein